MSGTLPGIAEASRTCPRCSLTRPATEEYFARRSGSSSHLWVSWCRACQRDHARARQAARRADPTEAARVRAEKRRHAQTPAGRQGRRRRKATENTARRTRVWNRPYRWGQDAWNDCQRRWCGRCAWCGRAGPLEQDHFVPLADPACPGTVPENMIPACPRCNRHKGAQDPFTWSPVVAQQIALHLRALAARR